MMLSGNKYPCPVCMILFLKSLILVEIERNVTGSVRIFECTNSQNCGVSRITVEFNPEMVMPSDAIKIG